jgi:hypothetical protein
MQGKLGGGGQLEFLDVGGRIILKWIRFWIGPGGALL